MNILPKKRWHVRTKDNIARVRRDQANYKETQRNIVERVNLAKCETRIKELRQKSLALNPDDSNHVNLFYDAEAGNKPASKPNKEHLKEKKDETEEYEKKIGYLTYLGQDCVGERPWYEKNPQDRRPNKHKHPEDIFDKLCSLKKPSDITKKHCLNNSKIKKHISIKNKKDGDNKLHEMRLARLKRESEEKLRQDLLFKKINNVESASKEKKVETVTRMVQKYNSQFNPEIAKQNVRN